MGPEDDNYTPTAIAAPLGGRYQILRSLGSGSFGQTFLAADLHLPGQPQCVVKQLRPVVKSEQSLQTARRLFETEANVLARLGEHAQIPRLLAHFEENEEFYLVQELIQGQDLSVELSALQNQTGRRWSDGEAIAFLHDLLSTLSFVHKHGVIHRDIKPSNLIRRQQDQRIVLIDFGAVKQVGTRLVVNQLESGPGTSQTSPPRTIAIGTEGYMPPEQISGYPQFSSDIYAVGMIAIEGLAGQHPSSYSTAGIDWRRLNQQVNPALKDLIDKMVSYDFRTRYDSAPTALSALRALPSSLLGTAGLSGSATKKPTGTTAPATATVAATPTMSTATVSTATVAVASNPQKAAGSTRANSGAKDIKETTAAMTWLIPIAMGIAVPAMLGVGIFAAQKLPIGPERPGSEEVAQREAAEREAAEKAAAEREAAEKEAAKREADGKNAIAHLEQLYRHLSAKDWKQASLLYSPGIAGKFSPDFFQDFEQVTIENFQITYQTAEVIELVGENTYVYPDGSFQIEDRTYTIEFINDQPIVRETFLLQVLQPR